MTWVVHQFSTHPDAGQGKERRSTRGLPGGRDVDVGPHNPIVDESLELRASRRMADRCRAFLMARDESEAHQQPSMWIWARPLAPPSPLSPPPPVWVPSAVV